MLGVEEFFNYYRPQEPILETFARSQGFDIEKKNNDISVPHVLATAIMREGTGDLRGIFRRLNTADISSPSRNILSILSSLPASDHSRVLMDVGGIVVGNTLLSIEDMLLTNTLNLQTYVDRYNLAVQGTLVLKLETPQNPIVNLSEADWFKMLGGAAKDKSFLGFFTHSQELVPPRLPEFIQSVTPVEVLRIAPKVFEFYGKQAEYLFSAQAKRGE